MNRRGRSAVPGPGHAYTGAHVGGPWRGGEKDGPGQEGGAWSGGLGGGAGSGAPYPGRHSGSATQLGEGYSYASPGLGRHGWRPFARDRDEGRAPRAQAYYEHGANFGAPARREASQSPQPRGPKGYQRSDERIREDIYERIISREHIDASEVTVEVKEGHVTLTGEVPERRMKHEIEDLAADCRGVQDVENRIRVRRAQNAQGASAGL